MLHIGYHLIQLVALSFALAAVSSEEQNQEWREDGLGPPDWEDDWLLMKSQDQDYSYRIRRHMLGEVPWKVKVLVKVLDGIYEGHVFEAATGGAMWDDDRGIPYCGVSYIYNEENVKLFAPSVTNAKESGRIACVGGVSWGDQPLQLMSSAKVKVLAWKRSSFPRPDFTSDWIQMNETTSFVEVEHNVTGGCSYMLVQIRGDSYDKIWYAEAVGASQDPFDVVDRAAVVAAYNDSVARVWRAINVEDLGNDRRQEPCFICIRDGWTSDKKIMITSGEVRMVGWRSLQKSSFGVIHKELVVGGSDLQHVHTIRLFPDGQPVDLESLFVSIQVAALDGVNQGFKFQAFGMTPVITESRSSYRNYGGVVYSFYGSSLNLYFPSGKRGFPINVINPWGGGHLAQTSSNVNVIVNVHRGPKIDRRVCRLEQQKRPRGKPKLETVSQEFICARKCCQLSSCECPGFIIRGQDCMLLRDITGILGSEEEGKSAFIRNM